MRTFVTAALLALVALPARAAVVVPVTEPPTAGVYNPNVGAAGEPDASSVERDPASLGFLRSWSAVYLHSELDPSGVVGGRGDGFFLSSAPIFDVLAVGGAVQFLRPPELFPYSNETKLSLAFAIKLAPMLSLGFDYAHLVASSGPADGLDTMDIALAGRVGPYLGASLVVHDLPGPHVNGLALERVYEPDLALRPFGNNWLELGAGVRIGERRGDVDPRFRVWVSPRRGVTLKADLEWRPQMGEVEDGLPSGVPLAVNETTVNDLRFAVGLELDLPHAGISGFGLFGRDEGNMNAHGFTIAARVSGERYPGLWQGPLRLEKVELGSGLTGRALAEELIHLHGLEHDPSVAGVLVMIGDLDGGYATAEELRGALLRLERAHKHVFAYVLDTTTRGYYVASAADRIFEDPAGGLRLLGIESSAMFFKGTADKLGVQADFIKIGEYKSAPEAYTRAGSTAPARLEREAILDDVYGHLVDGIASGRHLASAQARALIDRGPYTPKEALDAGLVDELTNDDEVEGAIAKQLGRHIAIADPRHSPERPASWAPPQLAVIYVEGDIVDGKSQDIPLVNLHLTGAQTLIPAIQAARANPRIRAIVLRIDSPGGSALASDLISREIERTRAVKPVVCSFGDLAASGGYYLAAPCQRIFAAPSTITGSIGIFSGKFDIAGLAAKLGISAELYERGKHAAIDSMWRPYTDEERALIMTKLRYYYGRFVDTVAQGRGLKAAQVDAVGRGRVWSGSAAAAHGLVDQLGGLADAIEDAKQRAGIAGKKTELVELPDRVSLLGQIASLFGLQSRAQNPFALAPELLRLIRALPASVLLAPSTPQARLDGEYQLR